MTVSSLGAGFDHAKLIFALRTAVFACIALAFGWAIGLEHPQWAAMSVWIASQPLRGQVLEKSLFRVLGTASGTLAGIVLIQAMQIHPAFLVIGLAIWIGLCTGIGNIQRGFVGYGTVLAGYTAAMVSLLDVTRPTDVLHLGLDRFATVLTGVAIATIASLVFASKTDIRQGFRRRVRALISDAIEQGGDPRGRGNALLSRLAALEEDLDPQTAGLLRGRHMIRATRALLIAVIPLLLPVSDEIVPEAARSELDRASDLLRSGKTAEAARLLAEISRSGALAKGPSDTLADLAAALADWGGVARPEGHARPVSAVHRDWVGAGEAMIRAGGAMLLFGALWLLTGWSAGNFMLLGLSVMISLFSTFENPAKMMRWVFTGQVCGVIGMLMCRWLVWPHMGAEWQLVVAMMPFILFGSLLVGYRGTLLISFDYNMVFLLLMQPTWPLYGSFTGSLMTGFATLLGPLAAWALYLMVFPTDLKRRLDTLTRMLYHDLADLARDPKADLHRPVWRARLYHRALRLIRMSEKYGRANDEATAQALATLEAGHSIALLHRFLDTPDHSASERRVARLALARAAQMEASPDRAREALSMARRRLGLSLAQV